VLESRRTERPALPLLAPLHVNRGEISSIQRDAGRDTVVLGSATGGREAARERKHQVPESEVSHGEPNEDEANGFRPATNSRTKACIKSGPGVNGSIQPSMITVGVPGAPIWWAKAMPAETFSGISPLRREHIRQERR